MRRFLVLLTVFLLAFPAVCSAETVVTSFYPVWLLALDLTDGLDDVTVLNLASPDTGCLHDYTLRPSDMAVLSQADALLVNGGGMESFLDLVQSANPDLPVISAFDETNIEPLRLSDDGEINSHFWLDPVRASAMAENLAAGLIQIMPQYRESIERNLDSLKTRLSALDAEMEAALREIPRRDVVIMHEAFPYFADACGLHAAAVVDKEPEDDLPVADLAALVRLVSSYDVLPLVIRSTEADPAAEALSAETGAPVCGLDTLTSGPSDPPPGYYEAVMMDNLRILLDALSDN